MDAQYQVLTNFHSPLRVKPGYALDNSHSPFFQHESPLRTKPGYAMSNLNSSYSLLIVSHLNVPCSFAYYFLLPHPVNHYHLYIASFAMNYFH